jgi:CBS domain containing-hemolysin-like protein
MLILKILLIFVLVALNGFFVGVEFAIVTSRRSRLEMIAGQGNRAAEIVKDWIENPAARDRLIAASQLGITIVSLALGSVGERTFEGLLAPWFEGAVLPQGWEFLTSLIAVLPLVFSLLIITSLHVVLGEQVPKVAVLHQPERAALLMARPMRVFTLVFRRFVDLLDWVTRRVLRWIGLQAVGEHTILYTVAELKQILSDSEESGVILQPEREIMHAVLDFGELVVRQVMVPRTEIVAVQAKASFDEMLAVFRTHTLTKVPVFDTDLDQVVGILHIKELLQMMGTQDCEACTARQLAHEPVYVPEGLKVNDLLRRFRDRRQHIAIVLDEYGGTAGLVTLEDLLEEIVGEVSDPFDSGVPDIHLQADGSYLVDGLTLIEDVNLLLSLDLEEPAYDTIAGYMLGKLRRMPQVGDSVEADGVRLQVQAMDALRIAQLSLTQLPPHPPLEQIPAEPR